MPPAKTLRHWQPYMRDHPRADFKELLAFRHPILRLFQPHKLVPAAARRAKSWMPSRCCGTSPLKPLQIATLPIARYPQRLAGCLAPTRCFPTGLCQIALLPLVSWAVCLPFSYFSICLNGLEHGDRLGIQKFTCRYRG